MGQCGVERVKKQEIVKERFADKLRDASLAFWVLSRSVRCGSGAPRGNTKEATMFGQMKSEVYNVKKSFIRFHL